MGGLVLPTDESVRLTYTRGDTAITLIPTDLLFRDVLLDQWSQISLADRAILLAVAQAITDTEQNR